MTANAFRTSGQPPVFCRFFWPTWYYDDAPFTISVIPNLAPNCGDGVRDLFSQCRNHLRDSKSPTRTAPADQRMSDYNLEGWKDSTWVRDR